MVLTVNLPREGEEQDNHKQGDFPPISGNQCHQCLFASTGALYIIMCRFPPDQLVRVKYDDDDGDGNGK